MRSAPSVLIALLPQQIDHLAVGAHRFAPRAAQAFDDATDAHLETLGVWRRPDHESGQHFRGIEPRTLAARHRLVDGDAFDLQPTGERRSMLRPREHKQLLPGGEALGKEIGHCRR